MQKCYDIDMLVETMQMTKADLDEIVALIDAGKVVAFPTDTVFGLGVKYDDGDALNRLKKAKNRPDHKAIPMMVSSLCQIESVAYVDERSQKLMEAFMPGAFTIVLKKKENVPSFVSNGMETVAIRMPCDAFVLSMIERLGKPMLVTSANLSDQPSCKTSEEVLKQLGGRIDAIVLGESKGYTSSTIVDVSGTKLNILREGDISEQAIRARLEEER